MSTTRDAASRGCDHGCGISRRNFLYGSVAGLLGTSLLGGCSTFWSRPEFAGEKIKQAGPASTYVPTVKAAFVRRKEEYGMWWPGAVYDGEAARAKYTALMKQHAEEIGMQLELRPEPIHSLAQAEEWVDEAKAAAVDGLFVVLLDRQKHSWPSAHKAAESGLPTVVFSPLGSSFTTNTIKLAPDPGCVIYSTVGGFDQAAYGLKMLAAGARMQRTRCVVIKGNRRHDRTLPELGIELRQVPASMFLEEYQKIGTPQEVVDMASSYMSMARQCSGATKQDVINGIRSYCVARNILQQEQADAITMDCLGALGKTDVSLPCIAWSRMNDDGVPAACEADPGAVAAHVMVQYLFDKPGFQQDPVADTEVDALIGAHCSCPTKLHGFSEPAEPFDIIHHHGNRDAIPRTLWKDGQRVTCLDVLPGNGGDKPTELLISEGTVVDNVDVPPAGGCVVSVRVDFDGGQDVLTFPGFHQLFFYGNHGRQLLDFCKLFKLQGQLV